MKFVFDVTAFDRAETVEVDAAEIGEALRMALDKANISVRIREIEGVDPAQVEGLKSIP
jgi:hypothetical protein